MTQDPTEILVVGAGIGGLAAALALAGPGRRVTVVERAPALTEVGAGLQLAPNAMKSAAFLGLAEPLAALASRPEAVELRVAGPDLAAFRLPLGAAAEARWGAPWLNIHRADLHACLRHAAEARGVAIQLAETADRVEPGDARPGGARARLRTSRGGLEADLIVAADGVRSALRAAVAGESRPQPSGNVAWRALVPAARVPAALAAPRTTLRLGPRAHMVTYPLRDGSLINLVAVEENSSPAEVPEGWAEPGDPARLAARFGGWSAETDALLAAVEAPLRWGLPVHAPLAPWRRGRVVLLGDAAHPATPFLAQGAGMALEDAVTLARALAAHPLPEALAAYEAARRPRTARLQRAAAAAGRRYHSRSLAERLAKGAVLGAWAALAPERAARLNGWIYAHDAATAPLPAPRGGP